MIHTYNSKATGDKITAASVNIIQDGLDQITSLWGTPSVGNARVVAGQKCDVTIINNWISWLKTYANRIGASSITNVLQNVEKNSTMYQSTVNSIYNATQSVKNWCNRSECNKSECNKSECNRDECQYSESNSGESQNYESNGSESCGGEW